MEESRIKYKFCPNCGKKQNNLARFCIECGQKLNDSEILIDNTSNNEANKKLKTIRGWLLVLCIGLFISPILDIVFLVYQDWTQISVSREALRVLFFTLIIHFVSAIASIYYVLKRKQRGILAIRVWLVVGFTTNTIFIVGTSDSPTQTVIFGLIGLTAWLIYTEKSKRIKKTLYIKEVREGLND